MRAWPWALLLGLLVASRAQAQDGARLEYLRSESASTCPDEAQLRAIVIGRLGVDPFAEPGPWVIRVHVDRGARGFEANVELIGEGGAVLGRREVQSEGTRCEDLVEALALTLSVVLDTVRDAYETPSQPADPPTVEPPLAPDESVLALSIPRDAPRDAPPDASAHEAPSDAPHPTPRPSFRLGGGAFVGRGELPEVDVGIELLARMRLRSASALVTASMNLPRESERLVSGGYARLAMARLAVAGCGHVSVVGLCGLLAVRAYFGSGRDVAVPANDFQVGVGLGARLEVDVLRRGPFVLLARGELLGAARRIEAVIDDTRVWLEPIVSGNVGVLACMELR